MHSRPAHTRTHASSSSWSTHWLHALIWTLCALALSSCAHGTRPTPGSPIPRELLVLMEPIPSTPDRLVQPCPAVLPAATDDAVPALLRNHRLGAGLYHACRERHAGLSEAVRTRERIEAERIERARAAMQGKNP